MSSRSRPPRKGEPGAGGASPARRVALRVLRRVDEGAFADRAFPAEANRADLEPRDRQQAHRLVFGTVQMRRTLDWLIDGATERPDRIEPAVRDVLRLGAYEIIASDDVPDRAAVDQAVYLARTLPGPRGKAPARGGIVNAVLRRIATEGAARLAALGDADAALRYSFPDWIADGLVRSLGQEDAVQVMAAANEAVWRHTSMDFWLGYKLWGAMPATLLFAFANIPMLMRHGLTTDKAEEPALPPQG